MDQRDWLIQDCRSSCGNCAFWWGPNRSGYVCSIDEAGRYTEEEAKAQEASRPTDRAVPLALAEKYALRHVRVDSNDGKFSLRREGKK